jgi:hypothetical protein
VAAGVLLELVATAIAVYCAARYGSRATLPHGAVAALIAAAVIELAGAVALSRALAPARVAFALSVPVLFVWPLVLTVLVGLYVATLGFGDPMLPLGRGPGGRVRESKRGRRRRQRQKVSGR